MVTHTLCLSAVLIHNYSTEGKQYYLVCNWNSFYVDPAHAPKIFCPITIHSGIKISNTRLKQLLWQMIKT
jgi:hypothetical protein